MNSGAMLLPREKAHFVLAGTPLLLLDGAPLGASEPDPGTALASLADWGSAVERTGGAVVVSPVLTDSPVLQVC